jgi:glycosyltransferase involved in cell wall biosynthesis
LIVIKPIVSVVMTVRNVSATIANCLHSILNQSFNNFEIIIIDDFSTDETKELIQELDDTRIKYFRNQKWLGISPSRNKGISKATGENLFFTDGDCIVSENWIEMGLKSLGFSNCVGVEGKIIYVSEDYKPTLSDHVMENICGGNFMTGNMAYKKVIMDKVGGFDERLTYLEDRDIAFRVMKYGKICFNPEMIVYHPQVITTPKRLIKSVANIKNRVYWYRKFRGRDFMLWRILYPQNLLKLLFPPLVFFSLFSKRFENSDDFRLLPFIYVYLVLQRLRIWKECARQKVYLI